MNQYLKKSLQFAVGTFHVARETFEKTIETLKKEEVFDKDKSKAVVQETVKSTQEAAQKFATQVKNVATSEKKESKTADLDVAEEVIAENQKGNV